MFVFQGAVHAADKIRIGFADVTAGLISLPLALKRGFFREEGLDTEIVRIRPPGALAALANGDIDYHSGIGPAVVAVIQGVSVKVVVGTSRLSYRQSPHISLF
jgi:ABC-type nitrate/sulfonate/bicarbonate transport system substrate-binding protein